MSLGNTRYVDRWENANREMRQGSGREDAPRMRSMVVMMWVMMRFGLCRIVGLLGVESRLTGDRARRCNCAEAGNESNGLELHGEIYRTSK